MFRRLFYRYPDLPGQGVVLRFRERTTRDRRFGMMENYTFDICHSRTGQYMGYVSLRLGESPEIYYLGHIGYRVEEAFRGHGYAAKAVRALVPLIQEKQMRSVTITTDTDNLPSRKTCLNLGCVLESTVPVPLRYRPLCMDSPAKCRYIYLLDSAAPERIDPNDASN